MFIGLFSICQTSISADADVRTIYFKAGMPSANGHLQSALAEGSLDVLGWNADLMARSARTKVRFEIIGATDSSECSGSQCVELSKRRAKFVREWLVTRGVPAGALMEPKGIGTGYPSGDNSTADGRARNRHVEFGILIPN
jgi:OOP family OmpA-OmpF porin